MIRRLAAAVAVSSVIFATGVVLEPAETSTGPKSSTTADAIRPASAVPYWKRCRTGYRCARAVLPHYFENWRYALRIVRCETGGTYSMYVVGDAGELSWWQFLVSVHTWIDRRRVVRDPRYATRIAYRMSKGGRDWDPWTCSRLV